MTKSLSRCGLPFYSSQIEKQCEDWHDTFLSWRLFSFLGISTVDWTQEFDMSWIMFHLVLYSYYSSGEQFLLRRIKRGIYLSYFFSSLRGMEERRKWSFFLNNYFMKRYVETIETFIIESGWEVWWVLETFLTSINWLLSLTSLSPVCTTESKSLPMQISDLSNTYKGS